LCMGTHHTPYTIHHTPHTTPHIYKAYFTKQSDFFTPHTAHYSRQHNISSIRLCWTQAPQGWLTSPPHGLCSCLPDGVMPATPFIGRAAARPGHGENDTWYRWRRTISQGTIWVIWDRCRQGPRVWYRLVDMKKRKTKHDTLRHYSALHFLLHFHFLFLLLLLGSITLSVYHPQRKAPSTNNHSSQLSLTIYLLYVFPICSYFFLFVTIGGCFLPLMRHQHRRP
jgi:hypothetical protein